MNLEERSRLSYFKKIADISSHENVSLVQHVETMQVFVRKELQVYDRGIYLYLMDHPSRYFPRIFDCVEDGGTLILIEEYFQGATLEAYVEKRGTFSLPETKRLMAQICAAVGELHSLRPPFIHRDLKPSNILIAKDGDIRIIDLNTARRYEKEQSRDTVIIGTKHYAAPEQYGFRQSDARTDIYALGVLMNYLLTGKYPEEEICPGAAGEVIQKCICFEPAGRYQSTMELARALAGPESFGSGGKNHARPYGGNSESIEDPISGKTGQAAFREKYRFPFLPPGFRTPKLWKMIAGSLGYIFVLWFALTAQWDLSNVPFHTQWPYRILLLAMLLAWIFLWFNYGNIHSRLLPVKKRGWKFLGLILYSFLVFLLVIIVLVIIQMFSF